MLEVSIAAAFIAVVGWDAFRRHLAQVKRESATMEQLKNHRLLLDLLELGQNAQDKKLGKLTTDLGAMNMTTPTGRARR